MGHNKLIPFNFPPVAKGGMLGMLAGAGGGWDYVDDFTTDTGWVNVAGVTYDYTTNNRANYDFQRDGNQDQGYKDLQDANALSSNLDDTAWVFRWNLALTSRIVSGGQHYYFGILDKGSGMTFTSGNYAIGIFLDNLNLKPASSNNQGLEANMTTLTSNANSWDWYTEQIRQSATAFVTSVYPDHTYTSASHTVSNTVSSSVVDLRYITGCNRAISATTDEAIGYWTDVYVANGVTTPP